MVGLSRMLGVIGLWRGIGLVYGSPMRSLSVLFAMWATVAPAMPDCAALTRVVDQLRAGADPVPLAGSQFCTVSRGIDGATSHHCAWGFDFRAADARAKADGLARVVQTCFAAVPQPPENPVNHPDTFDQVTLVGPTVAATIAVKDKGALNQTLVFLGIGPR